MPLLPLAEAQAHVLAACAPLHPSAVRLGDALGLVASVPITAESSVPPFDNSAMDGYAVRASDTVSAPCELTELGTLAAGASSDVVVGPGQALRIMTGAPLPAGADAIVMVELTEPGSSPGTVRIAEEVQLGTSVRRAGSDIAAGDVVLAKGTVLTPGVLGVLASLGASRAPCHRRPRVGVLSTGDELVAPGEPLGPGQIRDANRPMLLALVAQAGCTPVDLGIVRDDRTALVEAVSNGVEGCDALVTSGGVSVGDFDLAKAVLDELGEMRWMQIAIRPAKPFAFGVVGGVPVFGLPGNPVSSLVSFELLARPGLRALMGHAEVHRQQVPAVADVGFERDPDGKTHFVRVRSSVEADGRVHVAPVSGQGSHQLAAMAGADALVVLPDGDGVNAGAEVAALLLG
ncbi:MAG: Molybdopterin molybdenumtransferase [uncultured Acidimicrobiales bacterium]|uniref:Molybdopterin molybdenumtransferase n=1 Tax=uncultured Acidimicrobiales bacterium TaxID=310071 RepID=A0A6J4H6N6_9ACTN|nr:MAG: Molybdopterin molybdenumtransferase [uncultured Acidimicrobiales bacterium]